jgi:Ca-activated chloride channel family protein
MKPWSLALFLLASLAYPQASLKVDVRMIEVYASVSDENGHPVANLQPQDFRVLEDSHPQQIRVFEPQSSAMTIALLVDTTGSMVSDLPRVKNAVARLLTSVKAEDSVGLFTFASGLNKLSDFSTDRSATLGAILKTRAAGATALFDSLAQLARQLSRDAGKKAMLLFTDGDDNSSVLSLEASIKDVRRIGVPVYAMVYGRALTDEKLYKRLESIATSTGGIPFRVKNGNDLSEVFSRIGEDLQHMYLLGYQSDSDTAADWHAIKVSVPNRPKLKLRTKEGYWR